MNFIEISMKKGKKTCFFGFYSQRERLLVFSVFLPSPSSSLPLAHRRTSIPARGCCCCLCLTVLFEVPASVSSQNFFFLIFRLPDTSSELSSFSDETSRFETSLGVVKCSFVSVAFCTLLRDWRFFVAVKGVSFLALSPGVVVCVCSSVDFLLLGVVAVVVVVVEAAGDEGEDVIEDAAELGRSLSNVLTSNFRLRSRLK